MPFLRIVMPPPTLLLIAVRPFLLSGDALSDLYAIARGNVEQVGGAPDQIVLELVEAAVGIDDLPSRRCGDAPHRREID